MSNLIVIPAATFEQIDYENTYLPAWVPGINSPVAICIKVTSMSCLEEDRAKSLADGNTERVKYIDSIKELIQGQHITDS